MARKTSPNFATDFGARLPQTHQYPTVQQSSYNTYTSQPQYAPSQTTTAQPSSEQSTLLSPALPEPSMYSNRQYQLVETASLSTSAGQSGSRITATINSSVDLATDRRSFTLIFGTAQTKGSVSRIDGQPGTFRVTGTVPPQAAATDVTVYLAIRSEDDRQDLKTFEIGSFTYTSGTSDSQRAYSPTRDRKRKSSMDEEQLGSASKRLSRPPIRPKSVDYGSYGYQSASYNGSPVATGYASTPDSSRNYAIYQGYEPTSEPMPPPSYPAQCSPRQYPYVPYSSSPESHIPTTSAHWSQSHTASASSGAYGLGSQSLGGVSSSADEPVPTLVRTSTINMAQQGSPNGAGFNPYSRGLNKAQLNLEGDLLQMDKSWTSDEWNARRRLVRFYRYQKRDTIHARFEPANPNEKHPDSIIVSCIYWAEKNACYVTSVDCISLLESLIGARFTVEEKNRIRRNLEGFRPLTVSKAKPESENFFKLIMAFPPPKPRNIEKDVKVFPWSILPMALKKIIGKYSASYASTVSFIPPTPGTTRRPGPESEPSPSRHAHAGPSNHLPDPTVSLSAADSISHHTATAGSLGQSLHPPLIRNGRSDGLSMPALGLAPAPHIWESSLPAITHSLPPPQRTSQWDVSYVDAQQSTSHLSSPAGYYHPAAHTTADRESLTAGSQGSHHLHQL